jgi:hypothetical protein
MRYQFFFRFCASFSHPQFTTSPKPVACKFRVEQHRKNESEQGIPLPYYVGIDDIHFSILIALLEKRAARVLVKNWGDYRDEERVLRDIATVLHNDKLLPEVKFVAHVPASSRNVFVYQTADQVRATYASITAAQDSDVDPSVSAHLQSLKQCRSIYVPKQLMTVDPATKGVNEEHRKRYDINFYENEYKRVVMWHLSQLHHVNFY